MQIIIILRLLFSKVQIRVYRFCCGGERIVQKDFAFEPKKKRTYYYFVYDIEDAGLVAPICNELNSRGIPICYHKSSFSEVSKARLIQTVKKCYQVVIFVSNRMINENGSSMKVIVDTASKKHIKIHYILINTINEETLLERMKPFFADIKSYQTISVNIEDSYQENVEKLEKDIHFKKKPPVLRYRRAALVLMIVVICAIVSYFGFYKLMIANLKYDIGNDVVITGIDSEYTLLQLIPESIDNRQVKAIGEKAFYDSSNLRVVGLPNTVQSIGPRAFEKCTHLKCIYIPNSVTTIDNWAFEKCTGLVEFEIPDSVTKMGEGTFLGCTSLKKIRLSRSITSISEETFSGCTSLEQIEIPDSVIAINGAAFQDCARLSTIEIPDSVIGIAGDAFSGCSKLSEIKLPRNLKVITSSLFSGCSSLKNVEIPQHVTQICDYSFYDCENLNEITIPDSVSIIDDRAFKGCKKLNRVIISDSVNSIGSEAFWGCSELTQIHIPPSVTEIGDRAFFGCSGKLTKTEKDDGVSYHWTEIDFTIYGERNSYAETYANENHLKFVAIDE